MAPMMGMNTWRLMLLTTSDDTRIYSSISYPFRGPKKWTFLYYYRIANCEESKIYELEGKLTCDGSEAPVGPYVPIEELLDEKNGFLVDGALLVEYGVQVEAILDKTGVWGLVLVDRLFDCEERQNMISFMDVHQNRLVARHCHKQLLTFHSSHFDGSAGNQIIPIPHHMGISTISQFLQFANSVRFPVSAIQRLELLEIAHYYEMPNLIRFFEYQMIEDLDFFESLNSSFEKTMKEVEFAIKYKMRLYLTRLLKAKHCTNHARFSNWILEREKGTGLELEVMKAMVENIFDAGTFRNYALQ